MEVSRISLLLPTRGRPALVSRLFESIRDKTAHPGRMEVVLCMDDDDVGSHGISDSKIKITKIIGPRRSMGAYNSACLEKSEGDIVILINDDMVIRTDGWDNLVRQLDQRFSDKIYLGYGNDLYKGRDLCAFPILSRRCCEALTDPFPEAYQGAFIDYHLLDIFRRLGCAGHDRIVYLENLVFEHMHFRSGKAQIDATYQARNRFGDDDTFLRLRDARSTTARFLISGIEGASIQKQATSASSATASLMGATLLDRELPVRWAVRLFTWFLARRIASRILK